MKRLDRNVVWLCMLVLSALVVLSARHALATPPATPPAPAGTTPMQPAPTPSAATSATATPSAAPPTTPAPDPNTATIVFATMPAATATVHWGRKLLGKITPGKPLVVVRPRDSGPLDVIIRATGYLAVQTRAHTFSDTRVLVKLTPPENASELLGYRAPVDAGVPAEQAAALDAVAGPDGGVPAPSPLLPAAPPSPLLPGQTFQVVPPTPAPVLPLAPTQ